MLAAASLLSAFSPADGDTHGCEIWKSCGTSTVCVFLNCASRLNVHPKFSVSVVRWAHAVVASIAIIRNICLIECV